MSIPIVQVLAFVRTFISGIPAIKFRTLKSLDSQFVEACVIKFIPEHTPRIGMINYLIAIVDREQSSMINDIRMDDLNEIESDHPDIVDSDNVQAIIASKHKNLVPWIDAIYAGIWLMHTEIQLVVAQMDRDHALHAFANIDIDDESETSDNECFRASESCALYPDYFII